ncbi:MAG: hypothetical protein H0T88_05170 [Lysobacter sp.]|nr:hypothetical protein [Lysobacter sp.]
MSADKGYVDSAREFRLTKARWRVKVPREAKLGKPLGARQKRRNTTIAKVRHDQAGCVQPRAPGQPAQVRHCGVLTGKLRPNSAKTPKNRTARTALRAQ